MVPGAELWAWMIAGASNVAEKATIATSYHLGKNPEAFCKLAEGHSTYTHLETRVNGLVSNSLQHAGIDTLEWSLGGRKHLHCYFRSQNQSAWSQWWIRFIEGRGTAGELAKFLTTHTPLIIERGRLFFFHSCWPLSWIQVAHVPCAWAVGQWEWSTCTISVRERGTCERASSHLRTTY